MKPKIVTNKEVKAMFFGKLKQKFPPFYIKVVDGLNKRYFPLNIHNFIRVFIKKDY